MNVDRLRDVADISDQLLGRIVSHHPRHRRVGVDERAGRRRDIDAVDGRLEQFAVALLRKPLLGQRPYRRLARGIGVDQRAAEHFGGARDVADLVVDVGIRDRGVLFARGQRPDRACDRGQGTHGAANHERRRENPDQHAYRAENDALPLGLAQRAPKVVRQHPPLPIAELAQQLGHPPDQAAFGAEHLLVEARDIAFGAGDGNDGVGIGVGGGAKLRIIDLLRARAPRLLLGAFGIVRQQERRYLVLRPEHGPRVATVGRRGHSFFEPRAGRWQGLQQFGAVRDQRGDALDALAVVREPLGHAVDHGLLIGCEF